MERYDAWQRVLQLVSSEQQVVAARSNIDAVAVNEAIGRYKRGGHWQMALALLRNMKDWQRGHVHCEKCASKMVPGWPSGLLEIVMVMKCNEMLVTGVSSVATRSIVFPCYSLVKCRGRSASYVH